MNTKKLLKELLTVAAAVLTLAGCKEKGPHGNGGLEFDMMFTEEEITLEEGKSKNLEDYLVIEPESVGDTLTVEYASSNKKVATVSASGRVKALYEGRAVITASSHGKTAEIGVRVKPVKIESFTVPSGTVAVGVGESVDLEIGIAPENASPGHLQVTVSPDDARLKFEDNVWKFKSDHTGLYTITVSYGDVTKSFQVQSKVIAVSSVSMNKSSALLEIGKTLVLTATVSPSNATDKTLTWTSSDNTVATVNDGVCLAVKKGLVTITASASNGVKATCSLKVTDEDLSKIKLFSVRADKKVRFAPGNLQFTTSGTHLGGGGGSYKGTFRFAPTQYSMIGSGNSNISSSYTGWIDLFGSGTSGTGSDAVAKPWTSSAANYMYNRINDSSYDWGLFNEIQRGTDTDPAGQWRMLFVDEWKYLLETRARASELYGVGQVGGVCGLILLPDDWTAPEGVPFTAGVSASDELSAANYASVNNLTVSQWAAMEANGAVFLPAAGRRSGTTMDETLKGIYWTATQSDGQMRNYILKFQPFLVYTTWSEEWSEGCAVRLVQVF